MLRFVLRLWFQQRRGWGHRVSKPAASGVLVREARGDNAETCFHYFAHVCVYIYIVILYLCIYIYGYIYIYPYIQYSYFCPLNMICLQLFCICLLFCTMLWVWKWWFSRFAGLATSTFHHLFEFFDPPVITRWSFGLARTSDQKGNPHAPGELQICCGRSEFQLSLGPGR